jgi:hypothetical protein
MDYGLNARGSITGEDTKFYSVQTCSGAQPTFYPMDTGPLAPELKRPELEADHSFPYSAEVKNGGAIHPLLHKSSWRSA